jgi:hypothetical protein
MKEIVLVSLVAIVSMLSPIAANRVVRGDLDDTLKRWAAQEKEWERNHPDVVNMKAIPEYRYGIENNVDMR